MVFSASLLVSGWSVARAENFSARTAFFSRLSTPLRAVVDGKPFREGIEQLTQKAGVNVWVCRDIDPSARIKSGWLGPTVIEAIAKLADDHQCDVFPIENVLLVGPGPWCDRVAESIWSSPGALRQRSGDSSKVTLEWPQLTTPTEAQMQLDRSSNSTEVSPVSSDPLPHDLWPKSRLVDLAPPVAQRLILGQFCPWESSGDSEVPAVWRQRFPVLLADERVDRQFSHGYEQLDIAFANDSLSKLDPKMKAKKIRRRLAVRGTTTVHREAVLEMLAKEGEARLASQGKQEQTFTLNKAKSQAKNILRQLVQASGRECVIQPDAAEACEQVIELEGKDQTLRSLIDLAANKVGVSATWTDQQVVISK